MLSGSLAPFDDEYNREFILANSRQIVLRDVCPATVESFSSMKKLTTLMSTARVLAAGVMLMASGNAMAANLVQNGSFESNGGVGQIGSVTTLDNWTVGAATDSTPIPYSFVINANADSTGFNSSTGTIRIWGPNTPVGVSSGSGSFPNPHNVGPVANGWGTIPDGSYAFAANPAHANAPLSQTINGLTVGHQFTLSFNYAGVQSTDAEGVTQTGWHVALGGDVNQNTGGSSSGDLNNASQGFTGWQSFSYDFTATTNSETLTFLANGGPSSSSIPFALLDNVSLVDNTTPPPPSTVPEPSTIALLGTSLICIGAARTLRKKN